MAVTHGHAVGGKTSPTYVSWRAMMQRCRCPSHVAYPRYGGRGITVCERWLSFPNFLADMGERPDGLTLDRIKNHKGYEPGNCRWVTSKAQASNRKDNRFAEYGGEVMTLYQWSGRLGICPSTMFRRFRRGMSVAEIVAWNEARQGG